jgi:type I restriction enzyme R subunit
MLRWSTPQSAAMKDIKRRADFEVYLKKFLQSLNLILPNEIGASLSRPGPAIRLPAAHGEGALQGRLLDISDAGAKVKALINEHLIDLGHQSEDSACRAAFG